MYKNESRSVSLYNTQNMSPDEKHTPGGRTPWCPDYGSYNLTFLLKFAWILHMKILNPIGRRTYLRVFSGMFLS